MKHSTVYYRSLILYQPFESSFLVVEAAFTLERNPEVSWTSVRPDVKQTLLCQLLSTKSMYYPIEWVGELMTFRSCDRCWKKRGRPRWSDNHELKASEKSRCACAQFFSGWSERITIIFTASASLLMLHHLTLTHDEDLEILELLCLGKKLSPNPEGAIHLFPTAVASDFVEWEHYLFSHETWIAS